MTVIKKTVWDFPTRFFHWSIVLLVVISWRTAESGELLWHSRSGYALLTLLIFRVFWGLFGSSSARFANFVRSPKTVLQYAKTLPGKANTNTLGHNPLGGWSVICLLTLMFVQVGLGLFVEDVDGMDSGPLSYLVSYETGRLAADAHEICFNILTTFIVLHIAAVLFYWLYKKNNLIVSMITGKKSFTLAINKSNNNSSDENSNEISNQHSNQNPNDVKIAPVWLAAVILAIAAIFVWWLVR